MELDFKTQLTSQTLYVLDMQTRKVWTIDSDRSNVRTPYKDT